MKVRKKRPPNPLRIDPTRTITLRKAMCQHLRKQFAAIRFDLAQYLRAPVINAFCPTGEGGGVDPSCSPVREGKHGTEEGESMGMSPYEQYQMREEMGDYTPRTFFHGTSAEALKAIRTEGLIPGKGAGGDSAFGGAFQEFNVGDREVSVYITKKATVAAFYADMIAGKAGSEPVLLRITVPPGHKPTLKRDEQDPDGIRFIGPIPPGWIEHVPHLTENARGDVVYMVLFAQKGPTANAAPTKEKSFEKWLGEKFKTKLTSKNQEAIWQKYVDQGAKKGAKRAYKDVTKSKGDKFLKAAFAQPVSVEKVKYLATKTFDYVKGLTKKASLEMSKTLTDGLVEGKSPREVAKTLSKQLDITQARAETIARTELISAHAEGQLMALEMLGVEEVGVMVEWSTTGDDKVCEKCEAMQGVVLKIKKAKGMLPLHPNCRCAWIPANVGEDDEPVKKTKKAVKKGVEDDELEFIWNAFCPTGEGGGVDPSCSPGVSARIPEGAKARFKQNVDAVHKHPDNITAGKSLIDATIAGTPDITFDEKRDLMRLRNDVVSGKKVLAGGYIPGLKQIHVGPGYAPGEGPVGELLPHNTAAHVYAHEYTHGLDGPDHEYSSSREWAEAHQEAKTLTRYAATHESESFAEFGRLLYAGDADHAEVTRRFPKASAFFKQKGLWPGLTQNRSFFADCERDEKGRCLPSGAGARVSDAELKSAQKLARSKAKKTAEPSQEAVDRAEKEMPEIGANAYRKKLVGNKYQREARRNKLLKEFGDGKHCPCVYCGVKVTHGTLEQDKIYTTIQGGKYTMDNLVPSCGGCNKQRGDIPWKNIKWPKG